MPTNRDITALRAAIDQGDDTVLPFLADALEDAGDPRTAGLRRALRLGFKPEAGWGHWRVSRNARPKRAQGRVSYEEFARLREGDLHTVGAAMWREFPTRSAAYLALADALVGGG